MMSDVNVSPNPDEYGADKIKNPRGPRGGAPAARHVHRLDRCARAPPSGLRGGGQLDRRGARRLLRHDQRHHPHRPLGDGRRQRARHPDRHARERAVRGRGRHDRAARGRQVRQRELQGVGRPARRRRLGRQRALRNARPRDLAQRPRLQADVRARQAGRGSRDLGQDQEARDEDHVPARRPGLRDARVQLRHAGAAAPRAGLPQPGRGDHARRRARRRAQPPVPVPRAASASS